jgi:hypothetical protein
MAKLRVLLIEFLNPDPFNTHRVETFALTQGYLRAYKIPTKWLSIVATADDRKLSRWTIGPSRAKQQKLVAQIHDFAPTHIITNDQLAQDTIDNVRELLPNIVFLPANSLFLHTGTFNELFSFLGNTVGDTQGSSSLFDIGIADWDSQLVGEPPLQLLNKVAAGPSCLYRASFKSNEFFADIDIDSLYYKDACTFCTFPRDMKRGVPKWNAVDLVLHQLEQFYRTAPEFRRHRSIRIDSVISFRQLDRFFQGVFDRDFPASSFFMSCRIDEALVQRDTLIKWMPLLADRGHGLSLWSIGLENFSPTENERFNKGISTQQIHDVILLFDHLEQTWPGVFNFRELGGFGMIVFTPWTSLEDLQINVDALKTYGKGQVLGPLLSRLQLRPDTALEALAIRDGLAYDSSKLGEVPSDRSCLTEPTDREIPWRFKNPEVAQIWELLSEWFLDGPHPASSLMTPERALESLVAVSKNHPGITKDLLAKKTLEMWQADAKDGASDLSTADDGFDGWALGVIKLIRRATNNGRIPLAGFKLEHAGAVENSADVELVFRNCSELDSEQGSLVALHISDKSKAQAFLNLENYAIRYRSDTPLDSPEKVLLAKLVARIVMTLKP